MAARNSAARARTKRFASYREPLRWSRPLGVFVPSWFICIVPAEPERCSWGTAILAVGPAGVLPIVFGRICALGASGGAVGEFGGGGEAARVGFCPRVRHGATRRPGDRAT